MESGSQAVGLRRLKGTAAAILALMEQRNVLLKACQLSFGGDVSMWFDEVEKLFSFFQELESSHVHLIMPVLTERVRSSLRSLNEEQCSDFETIE